MKKDKPNTLYTFITLLIKVSFFPKGDGFVTIEKIREYLGS